MKQIFFVMFVVLSLRASFAGPKCLSGSEMPFQQVFNEKTGLNKALQASNLAGLDLNEIENACMAICSRDTKLFYDSIEIMIKDKKLNREERIKKFFKEYFDETRCNEDIVVYGTRSCDNSGQNFLRSAFEDFVDLTVDDMIVNQNIDLNRKDSLDGKSTMEWLNMKCNDKTQDAVVSKYFCTQEKNYKCRAFKQLPKGEQANPPKGCAI